MADDFTKAVTGEARDGDYWQSNLAKDAKPKVSPGDHASPDSDRTKLRPPNTKLGSDK